MEGVRLRIGLDRCLSVFNCGDYVLGGYKACARSDLELRIYRTEVARGSHQNVMGSQSKDGACALCLIGNDHCQLSTASLR